MKKTLLTILALFFSPIFIFAQSDPPLLEDFAKGIQSINTIALNDHVNIVQINTDNENFDLVAVNDKMQVLWKTTLAGYSIKTDVFKNKVVAVATTEHSFLKGLTMFIRRF